MPEMFERRATPRASTWNPETWTFDAVVSTGAPVTRYDLRGEYSEELDINPKLIGTWAQVLAFLDAHKRDSVDSVLGSARNFRAESGALLCTITLSRNSLRAQRIAADIEAGHPWTFSIGYAVDAWAERTAPQNGRRTKTATEWTLLEVSVVPISADPATGIRSALPMPTPQTPEPAPQPPPPPAQPQTTERAAINAEIRTIARVSGLDQTWTDSQIDRGVTPDQARAAAFEAMQARTAQHQVRNATIIQDHTDPAVRAAHMGEALFTRFNPAHKPSEPARAYVGLTIPELAKESLRARSISTTGLSTASVIERALTTSDFPIILGDTVNRTLRQSYDAAPSGLRRLARQTTARDFRAKTKVQLSEAPTLEKVSENGEFRYGGMTEAKESYRLETFGKIISISRQMLVNDDLGAFGDLSRKMGTAAAAFENATLASLIVANPVMGDGTALFHASHNNLTSPGAVISAAELDKARKPMRRQTGLTSELISVTPKHVVVSPDLETTAETVLASIAATKTADVNPFANLTLSVEPRFTGNAWYVAADPSEIDGLEFCYLEGEPGPQISQQIGFDVDGVKLKIRLDFAAAFVEWRSWHRNAGA